MADETGQDSEAGIETPASREELLRSEYLGQTAKIPWHDLQVHFARGAVVKVDREFDLVEVAVQLGMDNTALFQTWIDAGQVAAVSPEEAQAWYDANHTLWAVVAAPWVLVQDRA